MKNKTKFFNSLLTTICAVVVTLTSVLLLSACGTMYHSKAGTMEDMVGTYKLTTYTQKDDGTEVNRISQWHVKAYLVVGADGHGYYAYQDDNTPFWYDTVLINYNHDDTETELYKSIQFSRGVTNEQHYIDHQKPGNGYEAVMGFNKNNKTFNYFIPDYKPTMRGVVPSYYTDVVYTKISNKTDLTTVESETDRTLPALPKFETKTLDGFLIFTAGMPNSEVAESAGEPEKANNPLYDKYKYYIVDFDAVTETADIYYQLTTDDAKPQHQSNVPIPVNVYIDSDGSRKVTLKFFDQDYSTTVSFVNGTPWYLNYTVWTNPDAQGSRTEVYGNSFGKLSTESSIEDVIAAQLENYNQSQNQN